jgi:predicted sugar kinase
VPFASASSTLPFHGSIEALIDRLAALGVRGAAQSSWGPAVLACVASEAEAEGVAEALAADGLRSTHDISVVGFKAKGARLRPITPPAR